MRLISKTKVNLQNDRNGEHSEYVQIEVYYQKESDDKRWRFDVKDYAILNKDEENESKIQLTFFEGQPVQKTYYKTYTEFDSEMLQLKEAFPSELTGSELSDWLVIQGSLVQLQYDPIYNVEFEER